MILGNPKVVLLTAATTPIGRAIAQALVQHAHAQLVVCVYGPDEREPAHWLDKIVYMRADLTRHRDIRDLLFDDRRPAIDTIVHTPLHRDPRDRGRGVFEKNVESTRILLTLADEQRRVERFVLRSHADVYRIESDQPSLIEENHPLEFSSPTAQSVRNHAEADLLTCAQMGSSRLQIAVLRCAEILAPDSGSRLHDYLGSRICLRPLGFDPMLNVLSQADAARAVALAVAGNARGVFNIPGRDTLPLSELIHCCRRVGLVLPGPLLAPLYSLRTRLTRSRFQYAIDRGRMHYAGILDGEKAKRSLGYTPEQSIQFDTLFADHGSMPTPSEPNAAIGGS